MFQESQNARETVTGNHIWRFPPKRMLTLLAILRTPSPSRFRCRSLNQGPGPTGLTYDIQLLRVNESQDLDVTSCAPSANAGPFRAAQGPFIYSLAQIYIVPRKRHKGARNRQASDVSALDTGGLFALLSEKGSVTKGSIPSLNVAFPIKKIGQKEVITEEGSLPTRHTRSGISTPAVTLNTAWRGRKKGSGAGRGSGWDPGKFPTLLRAT